jgi:hypothetical protein
MKTTVKKLRQIAVSTEIRTGYPSSGKQKCHRLEKLAAGETAYTLMCLGEEFLLIHFQEN